MIEFIKKEKENLRSLESKKVKEKSIKLIILFG